MSEGIIVALITAIPVIFVGVVNLIVTLRTLAVASQVKHQTDGLVEASKASSKAEGVTQGHAEAAANTAANTPPGAA